MKYYEFYSKNALEWVWQYECIEKKFMYGNRLNSFILRKSWKVFYNKKALEMVFLLEGIGKGFAIRMHWKGFCYKNALETVSQ